MVQKEEVKDQTSQVERSFQRIPPGWALHRPGSHTAVSHPLSGQQAQPQRKALGWIPGGQTCATLCYIS